MANPYSFIAIAEGDISNDPRSPWSFLPTSLEQHEGSLLWTKPGYATYATTPTNDNIQYSSCAVYCYKLEQTVFLPPNMQKIDESNNAEASHKSYIAQYKNASATVEHYFKTHLPDNRNFERAILEWKETCDNLIENPHFSDGWDLPAFYPFYTEACLNALTNFFDKQKNTRDANIPLWNKRHEHATRMYNTWKQMFLYVTLPNNIPFPKCLWYHKFFYIHKIHQPETWKSFFEGTDYRYLATIN